MVSGRVLDAGLGIASGYAGRLLVEAGMDVIKLEPPEGDPLRQHSAQHRFEARRFEPNPTEKEKQAEKENPPETGVLFKFLHQGKRSHVIEGWPSLEETAADELLEGASMLIGSFASAQSGPKNLWGENLLDKYPQLVIVSITPYGQTGPYAGRPANEFIVQAESGALGMRGNLEHDPIHAGGQIIEWVSGAYAAVAGLAALYGVRKGVSDKRYVDLSLLEVAHMVCSNYTDLSHSLLGKPEILGPNRALEMPEIHPTKDGYVGFTANSRQQFDDLLVLIERTEWVGDEQLASYVGRRERRTEFVAAVNDWTKRHTTQEVLDAAVVFRLPCAPVYNGASILENEHLKARGVFIPDATDSFLQPRRPWLQNGEVAASKPPAPNLGEHTSKVEKNKVENKPAAAKNAGSEKAEQLPLAGLSVVDMTSWWAGPAGAQMLASLGADVLHVESIQKPDGMRMTGGLFAGQHQDWWERSMFFLHANINKRDLTLNLGNQEGARIIRELIAKADIVMENFTPRVMENFGLDFTELREINPDIISLRMPAFGLSGPWRDYPGFAQTMEQMSGMAWLTGHKFDQPHNQRGPSDPNAGMHAAFAALVGILTQPSDFEIPMIESALNSAAELVLEYTAYGHIMERESNRSPHAAPQNIYPAKTEAGESWLAVSVASDAQWDGLKAALKNPDWAQSSSLDSHNGRRQNHDLLDEKLTAWSKTLDVDEAVDVLTAHGVPAGKMRDARLAPTHPQFVAREYFEEVDHPAVGRHPIPTMPFRLSGVSKWIRRPAPTLGEHSEEVFLELGYSPEDIEGFFKSGLSGTSPLL